MLAFAVTLAPSVAHAANPQVPQGYGDSVPADSHDSPSCGSPNGPFYPAWDVVDTTGNVVSSCLAPNGWGASENGGTISVRTPVNALLASNYEVRYMEGRSYIAYGQLQRAF